MPTDGVQEVFHSDRVVEAHFRRRGYVIRPHLGDIPSSGNQNPGNIGPQQFATLPFTGGALRSRSSFSGINPLFHAHENSAGDIPLIETLGINSLQNGVFQSGRFTAAPHVSGDSFIHHYTDPDTLQAATRLLTFTTNGAIVDFLTGTALTTSGATGITGGYTHVVNNAGTEAVLDKLDTANEQAQTARRKYVIDYAASPQITISSISESSPYGSYVDETFADGSYTTTGSVTYPISKGAGFGLGITVNEALGTFNGAGSEVTIVTATAGGFTAETTVARAGTRPGKFDPLPNLELTLPNGNSKTLVLDELTESSSGSFEVQGGVIVSFDAAENISSKRGAVKILYSDPDVPVIVYEYTCRELSRAGGTAVITREAESGFYGVGVTTDTVETVSLEVGILIGETTHRTLFTDQSPQRVESALTSETAFSNGSEISPPYDPTSTTTSLTTNPYRKPLRYVTPLASLADTVHDNRYQIVVVDEDHWLVCITKNFDLTADAAPGAPRTQNPSVHIYAGGMDEDAALQALKDHLIARYNVDPVAHPTVLADLLADDWQNYEIRLDEVLQPSAI